MLTHFFLLSLRPGATLNRPPSPKLIFLRIAAYFHLLWSSSLRRVVSFSLNLHGRHMHHAQPELAFHRGTMRKSNICIRWLVMTPIGCSTLKGPA
jgi:hypothetical protein